MTTAPSPLDEAALEQAAPQIEAELRRLMQAGIRARRDGLPSSAPIRFTFARVFGTERTIQERDRFFVHVAPLVRKLVIEYATSGGTIGTDRLDVRSLNQWLVQLHGFDPECVRMIDLHYFAGLSLRETATALNLSPRAVISELRFAKAWLRARMRWVVRPEN